MGNQASRLDPCESSQNRMNKDPCLDNMRQLHNTEDPFKRQYSLPCIVDHDHIKPRKQSSPAIVDVSKGRIKKKLFKSSNDIPTMHNTNASCPTVVVQPEHYITQEWDDDYYSTIQNRKYHKVNGSNYLLPCDEEEVDRLHLQHFMIRFAIQGNYLAPVHDLLRKGSKVLDVGCGPGTWSMEIAGEYPKSTVIGIDMTPLFPREIKPSNCAFYQCNILDKLPFDDNTFDYIFMRFMHQAVDADRWSSILREITRILKPDGWIEWVEPDSEIHRSGPITKEFNHQMVQLMEHHQQDSSLGKCLQEKLKDTNQFENISSMFVSCPGGKWAGQLGQLTIQSWKAYYLALAPLLCQLQGITEKEYSEKLKQCWREADEHKTFENIHFCYAQKKK